MISINAFIRQFRQLRNPDYAKRAAGYFKTGKGEYGEGDQFLGIRVPDIRKQVQQHFQFSLDELENLLQSKYHEERMFALLCLVKQFQKTDSVRQKQIYKLYLENTRNINNWDLVDSSSHYIVGPYLQDRDRKPLYKLARSSLIWERRIAILATLHFIRNGDYSDTLAIAEILLHDREDLIHKAVGWMLREVGNNDKTVELAFLNKHYEKMPRVMLRYAIEKFSKKQRDEFLRPVSSNDVAR